MEEKERFEEVPPLLPGDKALRILRREASPKAPHCAQYPRSSYISQGHSYKDPSNTTDSYSRHALATFLLGFYLVERGVNEQITSYGYALWWCFTAMQTQGANSPGPITTPGRIIGSIWSIFSTVAFFGVIIGSFYAYFMLPRRRPTRELISAIQYNLDELENLSTDELETLRDTVARIVDAQISRLKEKSQGR